MSGPVMVLDADESNLGLNAMLGLEPPNSTIMDLLGGKPAVGEKLMASLRSGGKEKVKLFDTELSAGDLPGKLVSANGLLSLVRVGKIEHSMEGCACPMGVVARSFLNNLATREGWWVLVDTEAGIEHFGRGLLEGADYILVTVEPSHEAVMLAEKACGLAREAGKACGVALCRVDDENRPLLEEKLARTGLSPIGFVPYSASLARACLEGSALDTEPVRAELGRIISGVRANTESPGN